MDAINQFFQTLLQIGLCVAPFLVVGLIVGGVLLYNSHSKRQRRERLGLAIHGANNLALPALESLAPLDGMADSPIARELANCSQLLVGLTRGDVGILEQRVLKKSVEALQAYRQRAAYGVLPNAELESVRTQELERIDALSGGLSRLAEAAETGDAHAVMQSVQNASQLLAAAAQGHASFCQRLKDEGTPFPILPSAPPVMAPTLAFPMQSPELVPMQLMQQLPPEKQTLFIMQYNSVKKSPSTAVLLAALLGGVGAHKFYLGQGGLGIVYILFSWTWIPMILGIIEAFTISGYVHRQNAQKATEIASMLGVAG